MSKKVLIAYFSRKGNNYVSGRIENLEVGNTEVVASMIQKVTDGDIFEVESTNIYPKDYYETTKVAQDEYRKNARPKLTDTISHIDSYDVIFLGYPNWWGTMPMSVFTFLESYDFSGKEIIPFCTHEGSGMGRSEYDIKKLCPNADLKKGIAIRGSSVKNAEKEISKWVVKTLE